jgi:hypothetical protein
MGLGNGIYIFSRLGVLGYPTFSIVKVGELGRIYTLGVTVGGISGVSLSNRRVRQEARKE